MLLKTVRFLPVFESVLIPCAVVLVLILISALTGYCAIRVLTLVGWASLKLLKERKYEKISLSPW